VLTFSSNPTTGPLNKGERATALSQDAVLKLKRMSSIIFLKALSRLSFLLIGSSDTDYKRKIFSICTKEAKSKSLIEFGTAMKDKVVRFEVLDKHKWQAKLNEMLQM
jgi:hypothetical protein